MAIKELVTTAPYSSCWSLQGNSFPTHIPADVTNQLVWTYPSGAGRCYPLFLISQSQGRAWVCSIQELPGRYGCNNLILAGEEKEIFRWSNHIHLGGCCTRNVSSFCCRMVTRHWTCAFLKSPTPLLLPDNRNCKGCLHRISGNTCCRSNICIFSG